MMSFVLSLPSLKKLVVQGNGLTSGVTSGAPRYVVRGTTRQIAIAWRRERSWRNPGRISIHVSPPYFRSIHPTRRTAHRAFCRDNGRTRTLRCVVPVNFQTADTILTDFSRHCNRRYTPSCPHTVLTGLLCSIFSAPALTPTIIGSDEWSGPEHPVSSLWVELDEWLMRMVEYAGTEGDLRVTLKGRKICLESILA